MSHQADSMDAVVASILETMRLLELADRSVVSAQACCEGDAAAIAERLSCNLRFLYQVAELLRHEIERGQRVRTRQLAYAAI